MVEEVFVGNDAGLLPDLDDQGDNADGRGKEKSWKLPALLHPVQQLGGSHLHHLCFWIGDHFVNQGSVNLSLASQFCLHRGHHSMVSIMQRADAMPSLSKHWPEP